MRPLLLAVLSLSSACTTLRATNFETPRERATECENVCRGLGLELSAVVVIMNSAGCVCEKARGSSPSAGGSAASGGAVVAAVEAARRQQQSR